MMECVICASEDYECVSLALLEYVSARYSLEGEKACVMTGGSASLEKRGAGMREAKVAGAVVVAKEVTEDVGKMVSALHGMMLPEGTLNVVLFREGVGQEAAEAEWSNLRRAVLLAGFTGLGDKPETSGMPASLQAVFAPQGGAQSMNVVSCTATKPQWAQGAKQGLRMQLKKKKKKAEEEPVAREEVLKAWKLGGEDEELIDDDVLVDDIELPKMVAVENVPGDAKPKRKKACKNCSCGRKEMEEAEERAAASGQQNASVVDLANTNLTKEQIENPQSACGNCSLGDAFRCASCPYRGMPRFKLGEKIELTTSMLEADVL